MKAGIAVSVLTVLGIGILARSGKPDGCLMPTMKAWKERRERSLINEPDQKAMIYFHDGIEQLVISPGFDGAVGDFAWVVPVPSRPKVTILDGAPFHELARLVEPAPPQPMAMAKSAAGESFRGQVTVLERRTVGDYDVSVLESTGANALLRWLQANRYHLPEKAEAPMRSYIREGWTFVACRIKGEQSAGALHSGTLTPLRLIFPASKPIYPMRLSSANPQPFAVLLYVLVPHRIVPRYIPLTASSAPVNWSGGPLTLAGKVGPSKSVAFPTLAGLARTDLGVYMLRARFRPADCTHDFVWDLPLNVPVR